MKPLVCAMMVLAAWNQSAFADEASDPKKAYLSAAEAGAEFAVQGEYSGSFRTNDGDLKIGIQVIAEGAGKLAWAAYMGGLPGDGWDLEEPRRGTGEMQGNTGVIKGETGRGEIRDGNMTIFTNDNTRIGELPKTPRVSSTIGREPPPGAVVLFDGTTAEHFEGGRLSDDKLLMEGVTSKEKFQSAELHVEFMTSFMPHARGQARSNSGCYLQGRYEVQILDSFGLAGDDHECGGIYEISKPKVNMCFPPLSWQTYDIEFHAAKYDGSGTKSADAWMTVRHNGVLIHEKVKLPRATRAAPVAEGPDPGPVYMQDHGNPVRFRNLWIKTIAD
jgi:hypothetical protein